MVEQLARTLATEFPDYVELFNLLQLASLTWPRYGLSAADLARLDPWVLEMIRLMLAE